MGSGHDSSGFAAALAEARTPHSADVSPAASITKDSVESRDIHASCMSLRSNGGQLANRDGASSARAGATIELLMRSVGNLNYQRQRGLTTVDNEQQEEIGTSAELSRRRLHHPDNASSSQPGEFVVEDMTPSDEQRSPRQESPEEDVTPSDEQRSHRQESPEEDMTPSDEQRDHGHESPEEDMTPSDEQRDHKQSSSEEDIALLEHTDHRHKCKASEIVTTGEWGNRQKSVALEELESKKEFHLGFTHEDDEGFQQGAEHPNEAELNQLANVLAHMAKQQSRCDKGVFSMNPEDSGPSSGYVTQGVSRVNSSLFGTKRRNLKGGDYDYGDTTDGNENGAKANGAKANGAKANGAKANGTRANGAKSSRFFLSCFCCG